MDAPRARRRIGAGEGRVLAGRVTPPDLAATRLPGVSVPRVPPRALPDGVPPGHPTTAAGVLPIDAAEVAGPAGVPTAR